MKVYVLKEDYVIPKGTLFGEAPVKTERYVPFYDCLLDIKSDFVAEFTLSEEAIQECPELFEEMDVSKEEILKDLVVKNRKASFDRNMSKYVNAETKQKVESIPGLTLHMSYATWNGPGFFKKFAKSLESKIKTGASDKEQIGRASCRERVSDYV